MTMRVTVKNEDSSRSAKVTTVSVAADGAKSESTHIAPKELKPGESADFWIYKEQELRVEEL